jgi:REP element-mobilizing transposase RayT
MQVDATQETPSSVGTRSIASLPPTSITTPTEAQNQFGPLKKDSLQSIIRGYKSAVTTWCKKNDYKDFAWQARYYDHIIRSEVTLSNIREYIGNNPLKWALDQENAAGAWM